MLVWKTTRVTLDNSFRFKWYNTGSFLIFQVGPFVVSIWRKL